MALSREDQIRPLGTRPPGAMPEHPADKGDARKVNLIKLQVALDCISK